MKRKIASKKGTMDETIHYLYERMMLGREYARQLSEIQAFAANPKYPYFDRVKGDMLLIIQTGEASTLLGAYKLACRARGLPTRGKARAKAARKK